jgi:hypothetical protein
MTPAVARILSSMVMINARHRSDHTAADEKFVIGDFVLAIDDENQGIDAQINRTAGVV